MKRIAIIGAGFSGLTLAKKLSQHADVIVFEKARGVGGRMSTRRADSFAFDHGAPFFTAHTPKFRDFLQPYIRSGLVAHWKGQIINLEKGKPETDDPTPEEYFVPVPHMNSLCKELAQGMNVHLSREVAPLTQKQPKGWLLLTKDGQDLGHFDWVISTAPAPQTTCLFSQFLPHDTSFNNLKMAARFTLMIGFNKPWHKAWIGAKVHASPLEWIWVNSKKPGRDAQQTCLVVHSSGDWAHNHLDHPMEDNQRVMLEQLASVTGLTLTSPDYLSCHRWRYGLCENTQEFSPFINTNLQIAACGDWCSMSGIERAWFDAHTLANQLCAYV